MSQPGFPYSAPWRLPFSQQLVRKQFGPPAQVASPPPPYTTYYPPPGASRGVRSQSGTSRHTPTALAAPAPPSGSLASNGRRGTVPNLDSVGRPGTTGNTAPLQRWEGPVPVPQTKSDNPSDDYDAVLTMQSFMDVYDRDRGWEVRCSKQGFLNNDLKGVRVILLGQCKSGKTWLLGRLAGRLWPSDCIKHTEGLSMKAVEQGPFGIVLLDTVGTNSPISKAISPSRKLDAQQVARRLQEQQLQEDFYRQLSFEVGQVILLVVGRMTHKHQADLVHLASAVSKGTRRKDIIVIHNLRECSRTQLEAERYPEHIKEIFDLEDAPLDVRVGGVPVRIIRQRGLFNGDGRTTSSPMQVTHYYLANDLSDRPYNDAAIADLRTVITNTAPIIKKLGEELATACSKLQGDFVTFTAPPPRIVFEAARPGGERPVGERLVAERSVPDSVAAKPLRSGSYVAAASEEVRHNVTAVPCTVLEVDEEGGSEDQGRSAYVLQIELPALNNFKAVKEAITSGRGLHRVAAQDGGPHTVVVEFEAQLLNLSKSLCSKVHEAVLERYGGRRQLVLSEDVSRQDLNEEGTRPTFAGGQCTTKVTIRTNIADCDSRWKPIVFYEDGILSITLVGEQP